MADSSELDGQASEEHVSSSPRPSPHASAANTNMNNTQDQDGTVGDSGPSPRKMRSPRRRTTGVAGADNQSTDTKSSVVSGDSGGLITISPKHKDPDRIKKDREREERVRQARERLEQERKRKLIDLQEQQRQAQENREKQLEMRRKKIEDLRRRDVERRAEVEKRRRERENAERSRRETLLLKAEERVARYEAWKRSGQKGPPPGGVMPTDKHLSASTSVLYQKRNFSSMGVLNDSNRPESLLALNTIPEGRRSVLAPSAPPPSRPKSVVTLNVSSVSSSSPGGVKLRENKPRKPRPASVATSMPSFVTLEPPRSSPRSKSTDRLARERSRPRGPASARRGEEKEKEEKKSGEKSSVKMSRRTLERLSTPRQLASLMNDKKEKEPASTPRRETNVARISARKAYSTSNLAVSTKKSATREKTPKEAAAKAQRPAAAPSPATVASAGSASPPMPSSHSPSDTPDRVASPTPGADEDGGSSVPQVRPTPPSSVEKPSGDISAEEYKARLAEKRRQAREKAEREAEEERKRQEELQRQEEERRRQEEEEQRRQDEEAMRLAEEARKAEEERLQKAIEAEEARRAEEAARLEQERLAKEEAERKAKEDAKRLEQEKQEKARRDEEDRQERKKRLEMIMKRVKTDSPGEGAKDSSKSVTSSPHKSVSSTASSDTSPTDPENKTVQAMAAQSAAADVSSQSTAQEVPAKVLTSAPSQEDSEPQHRTVQEEEESQPPVTAPPAPADVPEQETAPEMTGKPGTMERAESVEAVPAPVSSVPSSPAPQTEGGADKPKFKSPLLQKLVEGKDDASPLAGGGPRFKSPLLQNLLGKTKMRSMGSVQDHSMSDPNLSQIDSGARGQGDGDRHASSLGDVMTSSMVDMGTSDSNQKEVTNNNDEKDMDTSEDSSSSHSSPSWVSGKHIVSNGNENTSSIAVSAPSHEDSSSAVQPEPMEISTPMESSTTPAIMAASTASFWSGQDSGVSFGSDDLRSATPSASLQVSFNGHGPTHLVQSQGLEDSSISMRSAESVTSSITDSAAGSVFSSVSSLPLGQGLPTGDKEFEELIDLSVSNKSGASTTSPSTQKVLDNTDDLVNFNKVEEGPEETTAVPPPIIAFEDRRQDVPDILS